MNVLNIISIKSRLLGTWRIISKAQNSCILLSVLLFNSAAYPCDDGGLCVDKNQWSFGVAFGVGAKSNPLNKGSTIPQVLLFDIAWYGENAYFDNGELGYRWIDRNAFSMESYITFDRERVFFSFWDPGNILLTTTSSGSQDTVPPVEISIDDVERRDWAGLLGHRFNYHKGSQRWSLSVETDITNVHNGQAINLSYQKRWSGDKWQFLVSPSLTWKSENLIDYYYGIDANDNVDSRGFYSGKSGVQKGLSLLYTYQLSEQWQFITSTSYLSLHSGITNSPLVRDNSTRSLFIGAGYRF